MSDNRHFDLTGVSLRTSLAIAFDGATGGKAIAWAEQDVPHDDRPAAHRRRRLILYWSTGVTVGDSDHVPLPAPMDADQAESFVTAWLDAANYGPEPDHDGDNGRGHRVYCEDWGHVGNDSRAFVAIEPAWLIYGK